MKKGKRYKSLYMPAWTIVAAVLTLLIVIAVSTYRNMSREQGRMEESLVREGLVIIRAIEASVRAGFPDASPDVGRLQKLLEEVSQEPEAASIMIFDQNGAVVAATRATGPAGGNVREASSLNLLLREKGTVTRYRQFPEGVRAFEIILPFRPYPVQPMSAVPGGRATVQRGPLTQWSEDKMIALSLRLAAFETASREDRHHTLLMAAILVALGTGALYFLFIVQNYYLVDRSLDRMRSYTENVVDSMADGLLSLDREGMIVTVNRQAVDILGAGQRALEGRNIADILGRRWADILDFFTGQAVREREIEILRGGVRIPISLNVTPLKDETGQEIGSVILIKDLREIRELQEKVRRSERLASLGRLAAGVAHEIRNPLSSIRGFAQYFAKRLRGQEEDEEYAAVMVREVDRLNRVITELLDFAAPKEPGREPHSLEQIAEQALKLLAADFAARNVEVIREYEPALPPVPVDRDRISQMFINILLNAMESMEGGGTVRIGLRRASRPQTIEITIADTGPGIPDEDREKVFEPFFSRKKKGTGLGLAIVHQIIEGHGGDIGVESGAGGGTLFRILLPLGDAGEERV